MSEHDLDQMLDYEDECYYELVGIKCKYCGFWNDNRDVCIVCGAPLEDR